MWVCKDYWGFYVENVGMYGSFVVEWLCFYYGYVDVICFGLGYVG